MPNILGGHFGVFGSQRHFPSYSTYLIVWVFDFRKFITITDVSLQAMYISCALIVILGKLRNVEHWLA